MPGATTELNLQTAVDSDDNADYLTVSLANSLRTVDALFNNVSGHTHGGSHQGGQIAAGAIPAGTITSAMIADGAIATADLAPGAVDATKLAAGACTGAALGADVITTSNQAFTAWTNWSGAVTQGGTTPSFSTRTCRFKTVGKIAHLNFKFTFSSAGDGSGQPIQVTTLPATIHDTGYFAFGQFIFLHAGVFRTGVCFTTDGIAIQFLVDNNGAALGQAPLLAIASGDQLGGYCYFETA